jgi:[ribosomal protein S18]-alanine N-acetyltransferase
MGIRAAAASEETLRLLATWRYPPPYDFYDGDAEPVLNPERFFEARDELGELVGFYYFEPKPPELDFGLGLRPDLTGQGLGLRFFLAGLAFGRERYRPGRVVLHVASFNERARRVYERAGFHVVSSHVRSFERFGEVPFLTMAETQSSPVVGAPTLQLLAWIAEQPRGYAETIEAWKTSCPRLAVWEDALADKLVRVDRGCVTVTEAGRDVLSAAPGV